MKFIIEDDESFNELKNHIDLDKPLFEVKPPNIIKTEQVEFELTDQYISYIESLKYKNDLIFGKDLTLNIAALEIEHDQMLLFFNDGSMESRPVVHWLLASRPLDRHFTKLKGTQHYCYIRTFDTRKELTSQAAIWQKQNKDIYIVWNEKEAAMLFHGITLFKGTELKDVATLSFDIEADGLEHTPESNVFLITNKFRKGSNIIKKHFRLDNYEHAGEMIDDWCKWVQSVNPTIINGHNIFGYDLPYLDHVAMLYGTKLYLGRDGSAATFKQRTSEYRVDGNTSWSYKKCYIYGRHIIDGMFLAVKYDIGRDYPSWGLKAIAEHEGLVKPDRQFYDASKIAQNWNDLVEREKIVQYGIDDADDSMGLYDKMIAAYFYVGTFVAKPFQDMMTGATGAWLNSIMVRSYLQKGYSIPKAEDKAEFVGAISYGIPGKYSNCLKFDATSLYPSIIRQYRICDTLKDPDQYLLKLTDYFFKERVKHKKLGKETGLAYHKGMDAALKICANSIYGFLGTSGINFNSPKNASLVTLKGREILERSIMWATGKPFEYWKNKTEKIYND